MTTENIDISLLTQPELLDKSELIRILESRLVALNGSQKESKTILIDLFKRVAVPLPQRNYPDNHMGRRLTKLRKERIKKINSETPDKVNGLVNKPSNERKEKESENSRLKSSSDTINYERKKIKLNSNSEDPDKVTLKRHSTDSSSSSSSSNKQRKKIVWP